MNANNGVAVAQPSAKDVLLKKAKEMMVRTKFIDTEGVLGTAGQTWRWQDVLPQRLKDEIPTKGIQGWEAQYVSPVMEALRHNEDEKLVKQIIVEQIIKRGKKTQEIEAKGAQKLAEKATRAATPRSRTPARSAVNRALELEEKAAALKVKALEEERKKPLMNAVLPLSRQIRPNYNTISAQLQGKVRASALRALEEVGIGATANNAKRINKTRRSVSRAPSVGREKANETEPVKATRKNYKKEISIGEFCKEGMALQAKSETPLTVSDVLHAMAETRGSTRAKSTSKYQSLKEKVKAYVVNNAE